MKYSGDPCGEYLTGPDDNWYPWGHGIASAGEDVELSSASGDILDYVDYGDAGSWGAEAADADGKCSSLELADPGRDNSGAGGSASNWFASCTRHGTPGRPNDVASCGRG